MDSALEPKLISLISQLSSLSETMSMDSASTVISLVTEIISLVNSMDMDSPSELMSLVAQATSVFNSMDLDSEPKPLSDLVSLISRKIFLTNSLDSDLESETDAEFISLVAEIWSLDPKPELVSLICQILTLYTSPNSELEIKPETEPEVEQEEDHEWNTQNFYFEGNSKLVLIPIFYSYSESESEWDTKNLSNNLGNSMDLESESESKLLSLIFRLITLNPDPNSFASRDSLYLSLLLGDWLETKRKPKPMSIVGQIISIYNSIDLDSQPGPLSELKSLIKRTNYVFNSSDLDSQPKPLSELISLIRQEHSLVNEDKTVSLPPKLDPDRNFISLARQTMDLDIDPELKSVIHQIFYILISMSSEREKLISLYPQMKVRFEQGKFHVTERVKRGSNNNKWDCLFPTDWNKFRLRRDYDTHFLCKCCKGENHERSEKTPVQIKHLLHPKHFLKLVLLEEDNKTRKCYCCEEDLIQIFYYCSTCDFALNIACVENPPLLSVDHPKWHEHTLQLFSSQASLTCDVCALVHSSSPFYICPPCGFMVHQSCFSLPRVIRISRHLHRISFTPSFDEGDWFCGVCRRKIDNDYGGYSCIKEVCSYAAHSKCATQTNVWDGVDLDGVPEEIEEEVVEPFVRISDGIIQHFSHQRHHLKLDENTRRDYDEKKMCQACITPIYFGNFYSCLQCDYILHETCANLSRKMHHPIHPHLITLVVGYDGIIEYQKSKCSACLRICKAGFFYECGEEGCDFKLDVHCATISEPLVHQSHIHPLFLTSKPGERGTCCICKGICIASQEAYKEAFNCIDCEYSLCFKCATLPQKVGYKHDKHMLTLSYGEETSIMAFWCEVCEGELNPKECFYKCDEYCCVTLHIECLIGVDLYMKPNSSYNRDGNTVAILPNQDMSRPICSNCGMRCPHKLAFQFFGLLFCSVDCTFFGIID